MRTQRVVAGATTTLVLVLAIGCDRMASTAPATGEALALEAARGAAPKKLSAALCSPSGGGFTTESTNPYFPMEIGRQWILTGEENGESITLQATVLDRTQVIEGVTTRIIEERERHNGELNEVSWNYFAQASDGAICYFGEDVDIYEEGGISHEGTWCADDPGNQAGIFMPADPRPGTKFQIEVAPGVAEDEGTIVGIGPIEVPLARFTETIRIREFNPLDREKDYKIHAAGTGIIVDGPLALVDLNQTSGSAEQPTITRQTCGVWRRGSRGHSVNPAGFLFAERSA